MNISVIVFEAINAALSLLPIVIPFVAIVFLFIHPRSLLMIFMFLLGFQAIFVDVGVMVNIPRVLLFFTIVSLVIYLPNNLSDAIKKYPAKEILLILVLFFMASALFNIPFFPVKNIVTAYGSLSDALFRDRAGKEVSQLAMFMLRAAVPVVILAVGRSKETIKKMLMFMLAGTTSLCLFGIYQLVAYAYRLPVIYIYRGAMKPAGDVGVFSSPWGNLLRISSLAGEPKDLAGILLPVIILLGVLAWFIPKEGKNYVTKKRILWLLFVLHLTVFILTFSTAGWLAGLVGFAGVFLFIWRHLPKFKTVMSVCLLACVLVGIYVYVPSVAKLAQSRFSDRLNSDFLTNSDYGAPQLLHMYQTRPQTFFIGASLGGAMFYEQYNEQPESTIYYLFDYGVLGIALLMVFFFQVFKKYIGAIKKIGTETDAVAFSIFCAMFGAMIATFIFPKVDAMLTLWVMVGLCGAVVSLITEKDGKKEIVAHA